MTRRVLPGLLLLCLASPFTSGHALAQTAVSPDEILRRSLAGELTSPLKPEGNGVLPSTALSGPIVPEEYRLGPGDQLVVRWTGRVTRSEYVEVGPAGDLFLAEIGSMNVAGRTLASARDAILERLRRVTRDVQVEVTLARPRTFRVHVSGAVKGPGPVDAIGSSRVSDVLRNDSLLPGASRRNIRVIHRNGTEERADLERLLRLGDRSRDIPLLDGDAVVVPWASEFVWISGAVPSPGRIERAPGDSVRTLLRLAGGTLPAASPEGVTWIHWSGSAAPDTLRGSLVELDGGARDGALANEDRVFVRFVPDYRRMGEVQVLGEVARPGSYPIHVPGTHLSEVLTEAGGFLPAADRSAIRVQRRKEPSEDTPGSAETAESELLTKLQIQPRDLGVSEYEAYRAQRALHDEDLRVDWNAVARSPGSLDLLLRDGDIVTVERVTASVRVDGQVQRPGMVTFEPGKPMAFYVTQAGGFTSRAWHGHEQVTRAGNEHTLLAKNVRELAPGDFIWVPLRPERSLWASTGNILSALAQIATVVIAIRSVR